MTAAATEISVTLGWPPRPLSPNYRAKHWSEISNAMRDYRNACKVDALNVRNTLPRSSWPLAAPVQAHVVFVVAKGALPDVDNAIASIKAGLDGLVDAKLLRDDADIADVKAVVVRGEPGRPSIVSVVLRGASS